MEHARSVSPYPSDLTDAQWLVVEPLIPINTVGRPREVDMREVFHTILDSTAPAASIDRPADLRPSQGSWRPV
jgi:transposase